MQTPLTGTFDTLDVAFAAAATQHGDRLAFVDHSTLNAERLTYAQWFQKADALAAEFLRMGLKPKDVVALLLPTSIDYVIAYAATILAGACVTGLNPRLGVNETRSILDRCQPKIAIVDPTVFDLELPTDIKLVSSDSLASVYEHDGRGNEHPAADPSDPAVIIWTSGTTGDAKGAWFNHTNMKAAVLSAGAMSAPYDVKLVGTPFAHAGYMAKLWDQIAWAVTIVIPPTPWRPQEMLDLLVSEKITVAGGVPTQWIKLLELDEVSTADLSNIRVGLVATAPASPELIERVKETIGCSLVVRYAMTESPSITGTEQDDDSEVQFRTVGRPQVGMEIQIVDEADQQIEPGTVGRVKVRGGCVMQGYWNDPELTATVLGNDGWLASSDLGRLDERGNLILAGRSSDMYIRGGYNVYPLQVEHTLAEHPLVDRAAIVGSPAPVIGEIGVAFVVPADPEQPPSLAELREWVADRLADYKSPDRLVLLSELPLTAMMKIDKKDLGKRAALTTDDRKPKPI